MFSVNQLFKLQILFRSFVHLLWSCLSLSLIVKSSKVQLPLVELSESLSNSESRKVQLPLVELPVKEFSFLVIVKSSKVQFHGDS